MNSVIRALRSVSGRLSAAAGLPFSTVHYWEARYAAGGTSGVGSSGHLAAFKAETVNAFVEEHRLSSVVELGCGDGEQLALLRCERYVGLDVSESAVRACRRRFANDPGKSFFLYRPACFQDHADIFRADLALSLDVLYHLVEDEVYDEYLALLFGAASRFVVIYAPDSDRPPHSLARHVLFRRFSADVERRFPRWAGLVVGVRDLPGPGIDHPGPERPRRDGSSPCSTAAGECSM